MILHSHILYNSNIIIYENFLSQYMVLHFTLSFLQSHKAIFHTWLDRFNSDICISFIFQELHQRSHLPAIYLYCQMMGIAKGITGIGSRKRTKVRQQPEHGCRPDSPQLPAERGTDACRRIDGQALAGTHQSNAVATGSLIHIRSGNHNRNALPLQAV